MSKTSKVLGIFGILALASFLVLPFLMASQAHAQTPDYLITSTDTIPIFQTGAAAVKENGLAVLNVAVPYLAGAAVAFAVILILWIVVRYFKNHRA